MPIDQLFLLQGKYDIQIFDERQDINHLMKNHASFTGSPRKHPVREDMLVLVTDLFGSQPVYYEFKLSDISYVERLSNEVTADGEAATMARIWVKKGSVGIRCIPFVVDNIHIGKIL
jgi:inorganic pyrophosphatase